MSRINTINDFVIEMGNILNIDVQDLETLINSRLSLEERRLNDDQKIKINDLLSSDTRVRDYEKRLLHNQQKFNQLKNSIGELQVNVLLKKLKNVNNCDDVIRSFSSIINNNLEVVNKIITDNIMEDLRGGGNIYYNKYLKYKNKYLTHKYYNNG